ncbi:hypothetical protein RhiirC2_775199 [Rhizophagus irregularis]|uniref:Uncharacterized protein n=1 Tax=Rhizophagus irregularis TaxID=588596 RepID=A0A2N1NJW2_9GLOM|nr:hypothetical protein RhiirC2_775199 [Rhizophagus irregularis]
MVNNTRVIYALIIFLALHPTNFLYDRQVIDELSGFRNCTDYDYPIKLTELSFVPYPIVIGKWFFAKSTGINKVAIQQGATITSSFSYSAGNFNETVLNILPSGPNDPVNTNFIFDTKFEVDGTDQMKLMCIEGPLAINFP